MIDVKLPLRKAYYQLLNGAVIYNSAAIPVSSDMKKMADGPALTYILLSTQSGTDTSTFSSFDSQEEMLIDIVCKAKTRVDKEILDNIANQVMNLILPAPASTGLPPQVGIQISCVQKTMDKYLDFTLNPSTTVLRRLLTFTQKVRQTGFSTPDPTPPTFHSPITSIDFYTLNTYINPALNNRDYYLNNGTSFLLEGTDWIQEVGGGFQILTAGFDAVHNNYTIYILLK